MDFAEQQRQQESSSPNYHNFLVQKELDKSFNAEIFGFQVELKKLLKINEMLVVNHEDPSAELNFF